MKIPFLAAVSVVVALGVVACSEDKVTDIKGSDGAVLGEVNCSNNKFRLEKDKLRPQFQKVSGEWYSPKEFNEKWTTIEKFGSESVSKLATETYVELAKESCK